MGKHGRIGKGPCSTDEFDAQRDMCLGFFKETFEAVLPSLPIGARVLEMGCAEANWLKSMRALRPDLYLVGIDTRGPTRPDADEHILADFLEYDFPAASFDAIVAVSVVEWCGLGHYQGNTKQADGDRVMMQRARRWVKPGGWMYVDTPQAFGQTHPDGFIRRGPLRAYTDNGMEERLYQGLWRERYRKTFVVNHSDGPYVAVILDPI